MSKNNSTGAFVTGMIIGGAVGAIAGMLMTPRTGKETRRILRKTVAALPELAEDLSTSIQLHAEHFSETALHNWQDTLTRLQDAIASGIEASQIEAQKTKTEENRQPTPNNNTSEPRN